MTPNLRELMRHRGRTQKWLAEQIGVRKLTGRVLTRARVSPTECRRLARALEVAERDMAAILAETERRPYARSKAAMRRGAVMAMGA